MGDFIGRKPKILYGSVTGIFSKVIEYPFDTIKVRLQSQPDIGQLQFGGPIDCAKQLLKNEGFMGLYRGVSYPLLGAAAENASLFLVYNATKELLLKNVYRSHNELPVGGLVFSGFISGAVTSFILTPIELLKCKMQVMLLYDTQNSSALNTLVSSILKADGVLGLWRGQSGTFIRESGGSACWFGAYEYLSSALLNRRIRNGETKSNFDSIFAGALAGVFYNVSFFPADTIKSRMQTSPLTDKRSGHRHGFVDVASSIYKKGGLKAFYRGCGVTAFRSAPSSALVFVTYENLKELGRGYF
ncbi:mitochondrial carrier [Nadsonia fulvescens var. elongata DSM 6958]|uniref:Mitochondrial carrier n=1 Tax=Nadsonia fulvescens var. elongata DSM 6958 TaxID=857566 RepID=A0A1E3PP09_9ASCO|nr:mitochondrial carrier [Nadsonia fulvescens var. elongata DSM 6958]